MIWGVAGGLCAVILEILYRRGVDWSWPGVVVVAPLAVGVSYSVMKLVQSPGSFLAAVAWFGAAAALLRIGVAFTILSEPVSWKSFVATAALLVASMTRFL